MLTAAAAIALVWANSPWQATYTQIWEHSAHIRFTGFSDFTTVRAWVNGGIMTVFFLVVGLEIARERRSGPLTDRRTALAPVVGAFGGMVGAGLVYVLVNHEPPAGSGWGIPLATDIAFALGALALLGRRVPAGLRLFLLTLAVADDIGSVIVLAVFYSGRLDVPSLLGAVVVVVLMVLARRRWKRSAWPYLAGGVVLWGLMASAGVEPALAGVVVGVLIPGQLARANQGSPDPPISPSPDLSGSSGLSASIGSSGTSHLRDPSDRLESALSPVSTFVVLPLFALANIGVTVESTMLHHPGATGTFVGIVLARVLGKVGGITVACVVVVRLGIGRLPDDVSWGHLVGGAAVAGIGFTVPLLFAEQAFSSRPDLVAASQVALLVGSGAAFVVGAIVLVVVHRRLGGRSVAGPYAGAVGLPRPTRGRIRTRAGNEEAP